MHRDRDGVVRLRLNRPAVRNAVDGEMLVAIRDECRRIADDEDVRVAVLHGVHPAFSAGADLAWMAALADQGRDEVAGDLLHGALEAMDRIPVPVVAAVDGAAVGAGVAFAACADVVIATDRAWFSIPELAAGIVPEAVVPYLQRRVGPAWTGFWTLTGTRFAAEEARLAGLVHRVVAATRLEEEVATHVEALCAGPRPVVMATKRLLRAIGP